MELSDPNATPAANRRKSGRIIKRPDFFAESNLATPSRNSTKRKHEEVQANSDVSDENVESAEDEEGSDEGEPDEEEIKEMKRRQRRQKRPPKPRAKKARTRSPKTANLAIRSVSNKKRKTPRAAAARKELVVERSASDETTGLYVEIFTNGQTLDTVAGKWNSLFISNNVDAMCELVNFVLRCAGCTSKMQDSDIADADNVTDRINDLQEEYKMQKVNEYPMNSRVKGHAAFQNVVTSFFGLIIDNIAASGVLYSDPLLMDNIQLWIVTMSSSPLRPFRYTATIISLAITNALCDTINKLAGTISNMTRQRDGEQLKKRVNRGRVEEVSKKIDEAGQHKEILESFIRTFFDAVFVHRYRDIDPRIRSECMASIGYWIRTYPDFFFEGQYLRYLGWLLSDISSGTRHEVLKQLHLLYKFSQQNDSIGGLRTFTEKYCGRVVEIATQDADISVRTTAIGLLDDLRRAGLLGQEDIDSIGMLIFDSELRVRKAVARFFVESLDDLYISKTQNIRNYGRTLEEAFFSNDDIYDNNDYGSPNKKWLKFKCLVEVLQAYDTHDDGNLSDIVRVGPGSVNDITPVGCQSRVVLATQVIYNLLPELRHWEALAGYLLYDHSRTGELDFETPEAALRRECVLEEGQEIILLEVLNESVKLRLLRAVELETDKKGRKTKASKQESKEIQEATAQHLAQTIPLLLQKFGPVPEAASVILRLGHVLNQELDQNSTMYSNLLDDINKQFMTHTSQQVLSEASVALLHVKGFEELEEVTDGKVQLLWEDMINTLYMLVPGNDNGSLSGLHRDVLTHIANTLRRLASLARISDCTEVFETVPANLRNKSASTIRAVPPLNIFFRIISYAKATANPDNETATSEDSLIISAMQAALAYFMWKVSFTKTLIVTPASRTTVTFKTLLASLLHIHTRRRMFSTALAKIIYTRKGAEDHLRLTATTVLLDLYTLIATLRHLEPHKSLYENTGIAKEELSQRINSVILDVPWEVQRSIARIELNLARSFANKSHRKIDEGISILPRSPTNHNDQNTRGGGLNNNEEEHNNISPTVSPPASIWSSDDEEIDDKEEKLKNTQAALLAEKLLCEITGKIVLAMLARVIDKPLRDATDVKNSGTAGDLRTWLFAHKTKLGKNFREVVRFLEDYHNVKKDKVKVNEKTTAEKGKRRDSMRSESVEDDKIESDVEADTEEDLRKRELIEDGVREEDEEDDKGSDRYDEISDDGGDEMIGD